MKNNPSNNYNIPVPEIQNNAQRELIEQFYSRLTNIRDSILLPDLNLFYQRVPKVTGTSISRLLLCYLFNDPEWKSIGNANVHSIIERIIPKLTIYPKDYVYDKLNSTNLFKFAFVRNPYSRLVSCYKDKIAPLSTIREDIKQWIKVAQSFEVWKHFYEEPKYIIYNTLMRIVWWNEPYTPYSDEFKVATFEEFIRFICSQSDEEMDHHWEPQVNTINWNVIDYSFIWKQENYNQDMTQILDINQAPEFLYRLTKTKLNSTKSDQLTDYYNEDLQDLVFQRFKKDFNAFGYGYELPKN